MIKIYPYPVDLNRLAALAAWPAEGRGGGGREPEALFAVIRTLKSGG